MNITLIMFGVLCELIMLYKEISFLAGGLHGIDFAIAALTGLAFSVSSILIFFKIKSDYDSLSKANVPTLLVFSCLWVISLVSTSYSFSIVSERERVSYELLTKNTSLVNNELAEKKANLALCGENVYKKCKDPLNADIDKIVLKLNELKKNEANFTDYLASDNKISAIAVATNINKDNLIIGWAFFRGLMLNLLPFFLFYFVNYKKRERNNTSRYTRFSSVPKGASPLANTPVIISRVCDGCGATFETTRNNRKFCSPRCRTAYRERNPN